MPTSPTRRVHPEPLQVARRGTSREVNRRIVLNLIRTRQPLSRADLARLMGTRRGAVSLIVNDLIADGIVFEGAKGESLRGRKPKFLYIDSRQRVVVAVDIRPTRTYVMITDLMAEPVVGVSSFPTDRDAQTFIRALAARIIRLLADHRELGTCEGVGVVLPGMVSRDGGRLLFAPRLDWRDVPLREQLTKLTGLRVEVENSGRACALAQIWSARGDAPPPADLVFVSVSDGLGIGVLIGGELLRGRHNVAGEFGHVPLNIEGPPCACGASGCLEAYVSNLATLSRYFGRPLSPHQPIPPEFAALTVDDLVARARGGDSKALAALQSTAHYLGLGLGGLVNAIDPARIYVSGEIVGAWDLIEVPLKQALASRTLPPAGATLDIVPVPLPELPRLRGAAALVAAPALAARAGR